MSRQEGALAEIHALVSYTARHSERALELARQVEPEFGLPLAAGWSSGEAIQIARAAA